MRDQYDLVIVGAGMVGSAIALGLANSGLRIALLEKHRPEAFKPEQPIDLRVSALSPASVALLKRLNVWSQIERWRICPYKKMRVWELDPAQTKISALAERCVTEFDAAEIAAAQLGYIVENRLVQLALIEEIERNTQIRVIEQDLRSIDYSPGASLIELVDGTLLNARLMLAADGGHSRVRDAAGIGTHGWDYEQSALVVNVQIDAPQQEITWQQFTPEGPRALLPLPGNRASLVWYAPNQEITRLNSLSDADLLTEIVDHFPDLLPPIIEINARASFPLRRMHAQQYWKPGVVLAGDSAHQINPLAGQGVNLGFQDAETLVDLMLEAQAQGRFFADDQVLRTYERTRRTPNLLMMQTMDLFYRVFSNRLTPLRWARNLALGAAGQVAPLRRQVVKIASGLK